MNSQQEHFDTQRLNAIPITGVAERLGCVIKHVGATYKTHCPWHDDTNPSLTLYDGDTESHCYCYSCNKWGSVIDFVMQHENWSFQEACRWLSQEYVIGTTAPLGFVSRRRQKPTVMKQEPAYTYIPRDMMEALVSAENSLCRCMMRMFQPAAVEWFVEVYRIGSYPSGELEDSTVFPSIDRQGRVCNLKVQHYDTDPGSPRFCHSDRNPYWLGSIWLKEGKLPAGAHFQSACLFGEHLLSRNPESTVALVESPKNALFGALAFPEMTWVATGNKGMLKREVLKPLQGRNVIVIPDCDAVGVWTDTLRGMADLANFTVSDFCQRNAPQGQPKFDIADYLQQQRFVLPST